MSSPVGERVNVKALKLAADGTTALCWNVSRWAPVIWRCSTTS